MRLVNSADFKRHLDEFLELVSESPVTVNKLGKPVAVLLSVEEYACLRGLNELFRAARAAEAAAGDPLGLDEVMALILRGFSGPA